MINYLFAKIVRSGIIIFMLDLVNESNELNGEQGEECKK